MRIYGYILELGTLGTLWIMGRYVDPEKRVVGDWDVSSSDWDAMPKSTDGGVNVRYPALDVACCRCRFVPVPKDTQSSNRRVA